MTANGFVPAWPAAAFVGEHSFSRTLGRGPSQRGGSGGDGRFCPCTWPQKIGGLAALPAVPVSRGQGSEPIRPYYTPRDRHGAPINILKVKPKTDMAQCGGCGLCAARCPMGSIDPAGCVAGQGYLHQVLRLCQRLSLLAPSILMMPGYLYHQHELEEIYARPARNALFL